MVEDQTGYRVSVDLISGIHEHAQMISARPENPVHLIRVNDTQRAFAGYIVAVQCGMLLILWSDLSKVPAIVLEERPAADQAERWAGMEPLALMPADLSKKFRPRLCGRSREGSAVRAARNRHRQAGL